MWETKQLLFHIDFDCRENCGLATVWIPIKETVLIYIVFFFYMFIMFLECSC